MIRYMRDEQARYTMVELIGNLSLNSVEGHCGIPAGHIIAYKVRTVGWCWWWRSCTRLCILCVKKS